MTTKIPVELSSTPGIVDGSNATAITIDSSERVGIGTTSPASILHVDEGSDDDAKIIAETHAGGDPMILFSQGASGAGSPTWGIGLDAGSGTSDGLSIGFEDTGYNDFSLTSDSKLVITTAGNVGIGTTSPNAKLEVTGSSDGNLTSAIFANTVQGGTNDTVAVELQLAGTSGQVAASTLRAGKGEDWTSGTSRSGFLAIEAVLDGTNRQMAYFGSDGDGSSKVSFSTNNSERMRINSSGQLLLNTTSNNSDTYKMVVNCDSGSKGIDVRNVSYNSDNGAFRSVPPGNTSYRFAVMLNSSNSTVGKIEVTSNSTTYTTSSDYRLKENITTLENGIDRLNKLKPVKFNWIESGQEEEGFIAHEVEEVFSYAVTGEKDAVKNDGTVSPQHMDYGRITPLLVKAIQEQQEQIEQLKTKIQTLKGE